MRVAAGCLVVSLFLGGCGNQSASLTSSTVLKPKIENAPVETVPSPVEKPSPPSLEIFASIENDLRRVNCVFGSEKGKLSFQCIVPKGMEDVDKVVAMLREQKALLDKFHTTWKSLPSQELLEQGKRELLSAKAGLTERMSASVQDAAKDFEIRFASKYAGFKLMMASAKPKLDEMKELEAQLMRAERTLTYSKTRFYVKNQETGHVFVQYDPAMIRSEGEGGFKDQLKFIGLAQEYLKKFEQDEYVQAKVFSVITGDDPQNYRAVAMKMFFNKEPEVPASLNQDFNILSSKLLLAKELVFEVGNAEWLYDMKVAVHELEAEGLRLVVVPNEGFTVNGPSLVLWNMGWFDKNQHRRSLRSLNEKLEALKQVADRASKVKYPEFDRDGEVASAKMIERGLVETIAAVRAATREDLRARLVAHNERELARRSVIENQFLKNFPVPVSLNSMGVLLRPVGYLRLLSSKMKTLYFKEIVARDADHGADISGYEEEIKNVAREMQSHQYQPNGDEAPPTGNAAIQGVHRVMQRVFETWKRSEPAPAPVRPSYHPDEKENDPPFNPFVKPPIV